MKVAVVSGCLTEDDIMLLQQEQIHYFNNPLLYSTVLRALTRPPIGAFELDKPNPPEEEEIAPEPKRKPRWYQWRFRNQLSKSTRD